MLVRRRLSLGTGALLREPILRREDLADAQRASDVLLAAQAQAEALIAAAQTQCQRLLDQAAGEFWTQANDFLQALEDQRQALQISAVESAEAMLTLALTGLLDDTGVAERGRALVRHLAASQSYACNATLSCPPELFADLQAWVADSRFAALWQLRDDPSMPTQTLRLSSDAGEFDLDWPGLLRCLLAQGD
ncbi:HrpE/YscL family type III secretion apparatus protein [Pseudomonas caspiana]|nr:type III secretion system stator protein SctL [Pseudomonas caspiana]TPG88497.1 HrpE/YscL family type III secretion apparatus protein [Pseudomonas caspiana]